VEPGKPYAAEIAGRCIRERASSVNTRQIGYLADPVGNLLPNYNNLANERVRKVCDAATGDAIAQNPLGLKFTEHVRKRNRVVLGITVGKVQRAAK
jgi:hypothetical protein